MFDMEKIRWDVIDPLVMKKMEEMSHVCHHEVKPISSIWYSLWAVVLPPLTFITIEYYKHKHNSQYELYIIYDI